MRLKQFRRTGWPVLGSFAIGVLRTDGGTLDVQIERSESLIECELTTPLGGVYGWYRNW